MNRRAFLFSPLILLLTCSATSHEEDAQRIAIEELDKALHDWLITLFLVLLNDHTDQQRRFTEGAHKAIASYHFGRGRLGLPTAPVDHIRQVLLWSMDDALRAYLMRLLHTWMREHGGRPDEHNEELLRGAFRSYTNARRA